VTNFEGLLLALTNEQVDFIVVGGAAAIAHGASRLTQDLDIVYGRTGENLKRLVKALGPVRPYLRGAPPGLPFIFDEQALRNGLNFTLTTDLGDIDLLGEITGGGGYEALYAHTLPLEVFGIQCRGLNLDCLIHVKRAAGRPKDLEAIAELEAIREEGAT
jgi:hypothetical protein